MLNFLPVLPILIILALCAVRFWAQAIMLTLLWAMVEGAFRKWVFPGLQGPLLQIKDIVLICAYVGYLISANKDTTLGPKNGTLLTLIVLEAIFCFLQLFNPRSPSFLISLYGLKGYLVYLPLAFILPEILRDRERLMKLAMQVCIIAIPIGLLGLYQFSQPPSSWVNMYVSHEEGAQATASLFGEQGEGEFKYGRARTSSTFSYIGGFTTFVLMSVPLCIALLLSGQVRGRKMLVVAAALVLSVGGAVTTGSRTPIFIYAVTLPIMLLVGGAKGLIPTRQAFRFAAGIAFIGIATNVLFGDAISALAYRASNSDNTLTRLLSPLVELYSAMTLSPVMGYGIGSNSNAAVTLLGAGLLNSNGTGADFLWWLDGVAFELEPGRIMQELGLVGFVLVYIPKFYVIMMIISYIRQSSSRFFIGIHLACLMYIIPHLGLYTVNNPTGGLIYWALVGVAIAAARVDAKERRLIAEEQWAFRSLYGMPSRVLA